jgi:hypothetical protein
MPHTELITAKEFAQRISVGYRKALELMESRFFKENKITVKINPEDKNGGKRVNWSKFEKLRM